MPPACESQSRACSRQGGEQVAQAAAQAPVDHRKGQAVDQNGPEVGLQGDRQSPQQENSQARAVSPQPFIAVAAAAFHDQGQSQHKCRLGDFTRLQKQAVPGKPAFHAVDADAEGQHQA